MNYLSEKFASPSDFETIKIDDIKSITDSLEIHKIEQALLQTEGTSSLPSQKKAFGTLALICSFHFTPDDPEIFTPRFQSGTKRSPIPGDLDSDQNKTLAEIAAKIDHPVLRARIADVCWHNNKKLRNMATIAAEAYINSIEEYLSDQLSLSITTLHKPPSPIIDSLGRTLRIQKTLNIQKTRKLISLYKSCLTESIQSGSTKAFCNLCRLGAEHKIIDWEEIADKCKIFLNRADLYPMAAKEVWSLASQAYRRVGNKDESRACAIKSAEQLTLMREQTTSAMTKASWTRDLISELRQIGGMKERVDSLILELEQYSASAGEEYASFSLDLNIEKPRRNFRRLFGKLDISDALLQLGCLDIIPNKTGLHAECLKRQNESFLGSFFATIHLDKDGKQTAKTPAFDFKSAPTEEWYDHQSLMDLDIHYRISVASMIHPACQSIMGKHSLDSRHFWPIVSASPFVPRGYEQIFATGIAKFIQGDVLTASYLLFPQLENSLRAIISHAGKHTYKINTDTTEENQSLSQLLKNSDDHLSKIFHEDYIYLFKQLFEFKAGPSLRHKLAHGLLHTGECFSAPSVYGCWLIYHLCCGPLRDLWKRDIGPQIKESIL